jgi:iron complex outermembrane receptor protein
VFDQDLSVNGGNRLARWKHASARGAETSVQAYYDTCRRTDLGAGEDSNTADLDVQHHFVSLGAHDVVAGGGFRAVRSTVRASEMVSMAPVTRSDPLYSAFLQDEIRLTPDLWLQIPKFEHALIWICCKPSAQLARLQFPQ